MELSIFEPKIITNSSRLVQESIQAKQGNSTYGVIADFLDQNLEQLDTIAEQCGVWAAKSAVKAQYDKQYFDPKYKTKSFVTRNIYINPAKKEQMELNRFITGAAVQLGTEAALKFGTRKISSFFNEKDKIKTCEAVYALLLSYILSAEPNANTYRAICELDKIRNSFPIDKKARKKIYTSYSDNSNEIQIMDQVSVINPDDEALVCAVAYFIAVLHRQLYGDENPEDKQMRSYYQLIGLDGVYGKELLNENLYRYDEIAADQLAYLQLSRAMVKQLSVGLPEVDLFRIQQRATAMAAFDPYAIRRKKVKGSALVGVKTIAGVFLEMPEIAFDGISTALSQFIKDEQLLEVAANKMHEWGMSRKEAELAIENSGNIDRKCADNDSFSENE